MLLVVLCVVGGGETAGAPAVGTSPALPIVGMSPAKAETDSAQVRSSAIPNRFMSFLLFENYQKSGIARYQKSGIGK